MNKYSCSVTVTVTVTEARLLRPLLEDRGRTTESIRICIRILVKFRMQVRDAYPESASRLKPRTTGGGGASSGSVALLSYLSPFSIPPIRVAAAINLAVWGGP